MIENLLSYAKIVKGSSKRAITENSTDKVYYHKRYQFDEEYQLSYSLTQEDWHKSINEVSKSIKASDSSLANSNIQYEHNSFLLKDQPPFPTDKIIDFKEKSSDGNVIFKFISNDWEKKLTDEIDKKVKVEIEKLTGEIEKQNKKFNFIEQMTVYPVFIRQLRRLTKEKIFEKLGCGSQDFEKNCKDVKYIIGKYSRRRLMSNNEQGVINKLLVDWSIDELNSFFKDKDLNSQLNEDAHPSI